MLKTSERTSSGFLPQDPAVRGYHVVYRPEVITHCRACGRSDWLIGRVLAECDLCLTALPLMDGGMS